MWVSACCALSLSQLIWLEFNDFSSRHGSTQFEFNDLSTNPFCLKNVLHFQSTTVQFCWTTQLAFLVGHKRYRESNAVLLFGFSFKGFATALWYQSHEHRLLWSTCSLEIFQTYGTAWNSVLTGSCSSEENLSQRFWKYKNSSYILVQLFYTIFYEFLHHRHTSSI